MMKPGPFPNTQLAAVAAALVLIVVGLCVLAAQAWSTVPSAMSPLTAVCAIVFGAGLLASQCSRARIEAERFREAARVRDFYDQAPCGYHSSDINGRITEINDTELGWLGYSREEVIGKMNVAEVLSPRPFKALRRSSTNGSRSTITELEFELRCKDGRAIPVLVNSVPVKDESGRSIASRTTVFDITERKQAEARLDELLRERERQAADLEAINRELEAFSFSVSHDLRAPARHISGFAEMLRSHCGDELDATARRYLAVIATSATHMGRLIDDLLAFSRTARQEMHLGQVDLGRVVKEAREQLAPEANGRSIAWEIDSLPAVPGDPSMLRQVFINLLSNALKYTRPQSDVRIQIRNEAAGGEDEVCVRVSDNGVGFDMTSGGKLFGVFQRLHRADEFEGTGIGLANVRRIVQRHGGRIWAQSAPGEGAHFFFTLRTAGAA